MFTCHHTESRRDQEEGAELDSHEEASPEETTSGEVELGQRAGLLLLQLFRGFTLLSPFSHSSPSLIGLLASVDVKQQSQSHVVVGGGGGFFIIFM